MFWSVYRSALAVTTYRVQPREAFFGSQFKTKMNSNSNSAYPVKAGWLNAILNPLKEQFYAEKMEVLPKKKKKRQKD